jgi:hypothetical protein
VTIEARYAFASWNAIPLNPAISGEYIFGFGKSVKFATDDSRRKKLRRQPDAAERMSRCGNSKTVRIRAGALRANPK